MWLLGGRVPDHKTIADLRKDNGKALKKVCAHFVELCRTMGLLATASVAIDGSKFKAVNNRDRNFTRVAIAAVFVGGSIDIERLRNLQHHHRAHG
jgi:transposase